MVRREACQVDSVDQNMLRSVYLFLTELIKKYYRGIFYKVSSNTQHVVIGDQQILGSKKYVIHASY